MFYDSLFYSLDLYVNPFTNTIFLTTVAFYILKPSDVSSPNLFLLLTLLCCSELVSFSHNAPSIVLPSPGPPS